ncbi:methylmalonyl Co-A mutase-associated GTPase MeaB [Bacillus horti]|uniref:LAO/AO transport system kinase n=1 Tax=Caldalkalibacillus horti TaxID=77523 RepID=A0ABT9VVV3_9BACI|nr:methylmalonyl Co-A mutase-associated GTPase MeaB [Bacillus horti]MDQ0165121.1 LAO/AO transport system kinase [Bacillus horti]
MHELTKGILAKNVRALARAISYIEDQHPDRLTLLKELYPHTKKAYKLGLTGPPGAGKSSIVNELLTYLRKQDMTVGVLAVDPTSPFTGGALLGDRVRMANHFTDPGVFIRSMGTRGSLGGLARATKEAIHALDAFGLDVIIVETVGVGQAELDIMKFADSTAVLLTPNGGDSVQAFKAGIMEVADFYVINKADLPGTDKLKAEIEQMLDIAKHDSEWRPPVIKTVSTQRQGIDQLWLTCNQHRAFLRDTNEGIGRNRRRAEAEVRELLHHHFSIIIEDKLKDASLLAHFDQLKQGEQSPYDLAEKLIAKWGMQD